MEENKKTPQAESGDSVVKGIFHTYRAEFRKIVWPSRETLIKNTTVVVAVSLIFGAYIALMDGVFSALFRQFIGWVS